MLDSEKIKKLADNLQSNLLILLCFLIKLIIYGLCGLYLFIMYRLKYLTAGILENAAPEN